MFEGLEPWERESWLAEDGRSASLWVSGRTNYKAERVEEALADLGATGDMERVLGAQDAAFLVATWPSTEEPLLPALAARLNDRCNEVRAHALHALAACGTRSAPFADQIAERMTDTTGADPHSDHVKATAGDLPVWALTWAGDRRCVPALLSWLDSGGHTGFDDRPHGWAGPGLYLLDMPALSEVLAVAVPFAAELLPAVRKRLRSTSDHGWRREMAQILEAWGEDAAPAVPELIDLLPTAAGVWAARALGEIGPATAEAAPALRRLFEDQRGRWSRLTGRPRRVDVAVPPGSSGRSAVRDTTAAAAWAYWRVTGDAELPVPALARALDEGREYMTLWFLGDMWPPAAGTVPLMEAALALDLRLNSFGGWRGVNADQRDRRSLRDAIEAVSA